MSKVRIKVCSVSCSNRMKSDISKFLPAATWILSDALIVGNKATFQEVHFVTYLKIRASLR